MQTRFAGDDATALIVNDNTTIAYANFNSASGHLDYIFVNPQFRRQGFGGALVAECERRAGRSLVPSPPLSPLGASFFRAIGRGGA